MGSVAESQRNAMLNALVGRADYVASAGLFVQLHLGDPGAAGTANKATETTRIEGTFGSDASGGAIMNTAALEWAGVSTTEEYTWASLWDTDTDGTGVFLGKDDLSDPASMVAGDTFRIPIGELDITVT